MTQRSLTEILEAGLFSADSHVIEPLSVWKDCLPESFWPDGGKIYQGHPGGSDPRARLEETAQDGVVCEVLYPSLGLNLFALDDAATQEASCRAYNDWLAAYCAVAPEQLLGVAMISTYDADHTVAEIRRSVDLGLRGIVVWQSPHPDLPFTSDHYEAVWAEAAAAGLPVSLHILTGFDYSKQVHAQSSAGIESYRNAVNRKLSASVDSLFDIVFSGVLHRHPELRVVVVENEASWLPFIVDQWDYYYDRMHESKPLSINERPSAYCDRQVFATFFRDPVAPHMFDWWGSNNCMWSNDFPHRNSTWPESRRYVREHLGHLPSDVVTRLVSTTARALYGVSVPAIAVS